jgi:hypothetical protein
VALPVVMTEAPPETLVATEAKSCSANDERLGMLLLDVLKLAKESLEIPLTTEFVANECNEFVTEEFVADENLVDRRRVAVLWWVLWLWLL